MVQVANGAFSGDKNLDGSIHVPMWDDPTVWSEAYLSKVTPQPHTIQWYQNWGDGKKDWNTARLESLIARGEMPMISWGPRNPSTTNADTTYNHAAINAGTHDAYIDDWAAKAAAWGKPLIIRPMWEMNATIYSWCVGVQSQTGATYISAFRRFVDRFRAAGAHNVKWCWAPLAEGDISNLSSMYPGDAYVDYLGLDGYNSMSGVWRSPATVFDAAYSAVAAVSANKPFMFAEVGCMEEGGDKAAWITDFYNRIQSTYKRTRAVYWFDTNFSSRGERDWRINTTPASLTAYDSAISQPENMGSIEQGVQKVSESSATAVASTSLVVNKPTNPDGTALANGTVLIASIAKGAFGEPAVPSGWTQFLSQTDFNLPTQGNMRQTLAWRRVDGTEPASWTWTDPNATAVTWSATITAWKGCVVGGTPVEDAEAYGYDTVTVSQNPAGSVAPTAGAEIACPTVNPTDADRRIIGTIQTQYITDTTAAALEWDIRFTEESEVNAGTANNRTLGIGSSYEASTAGIVPSATLTAAQTRYVAASYALIPAPLVAPLPVKTQTLRPTNVSLVTGLTPNTDAAATAIIDEDPDDPAGTDYLTGTDPSSTSGTHPTQFVDAIAAVTGFNTTTWTNPANIIDQSDTNFGLFALGTNSVDYGSYFSFNAADFSAIPTGATITGITVAARMRATSANRLTAWLALGAANGSLLGTEYQVDGGTALPTTVGDFGTNAVWSVLPTRAQLVSGTFGVRLRIRRSNTVSAELYSIKATVSYTVPGSTTPIEVRVALANPTETLKTTESVNGEARFKFRKKGNGAAVPVTVQLRESGVLKGTLINGETVSSTVSEIKSADFDHKLITNPANVEFWITSPGVSGSLVEVGAVEWNAETTGPIANATWSTNTESDFHHYNLYRSQTSGTGFVKINTSDILVPQYYDDTIAVDQVYFYRVTSVDALGNESDPSDEFQVSTSAGPVVKNGTVAISRKATVTVQGVTRKSGTAAVAGKATVTAAAAVRKSGAAAVAGKATVTAAGQVTEITVKQGAAAISGKGTVTPSGITRKTGAAAIAGKATVTPSSVNRKTGAAAVAGKGTVTALGNTRKTGQAAIEGKATVTPGFLVTKRGEAAIAAKAAIGATGEQADGTVKVQGAAAISSKATVTPNGITRKTGAASISSKATIGAAGYTRKTGQIAISSGSTVTPAGITRKTGAANIASQATIGASGIAAKRGVAPIAGKGTVTPAGVTRKSGAAAISGKATMGAAALKVAVGQANIAAKGTISAASRKAIIAAAAVAGKATVTPAGITRKPATVAIAGKATVTPQMSPERRGAATITGKATVTAAAVVRKQGSVAVQGRATATVGSLAVRRGSAAINARGTILAASVASKRAAAAIAGKGTLVGTPVYVKRGGAAIAGKGTLSGLPVYVRLGSVAIVGKATVVVNGHAVKYGIVPIGGGSLITADAASYHLGRAPPLRIASVVGFSGTVSDIQDNVEDTADETYLAAI